MCKRRIYSTHDDEEALTSSTTNVIGKSEWIIDSGATQHHLCEVIALRDVLYLPELDKNLLSVRAKLGAVVLFENDLCKITHNARLLAVGVIRGKLCVVKNMEDQLNIASKELESDLFLYHCRRGHLDMDSVTKMANGNIVKGIGHLSSENKPLFEGCVMGKQHRYLYPKGTSYRAIEPFKLIHSDVCGP